MALWGARLRAGLPLGVPSLRPRAKLSPASWQVLASVRRSVHRSVQECAECAGVCGVCAGVCRSAGSVLGACAGVPSPGGSLCPSVFCDASCRHIFTPAIRSARLGLQVYLGPREAERRGSRAPHACPAGNSGAPPPSCAGQPPSLGAVPPAGLRSGPPARGPPCLPAVVTGSVESTETREEERQTARLKGSKSRSQVVSYLLSARVMCSVLHVF